MEKIMQSSNLFITGCDSNTRWMLDWFKEQFYKHNPNAQLHVFDFDHEFMEQQRWFKKPAAMKHATSMAANVCWIDTDIEVRDNIEDIFEHIRPNKLTVAVDQPWTIRRNEKWHNSGVVVFNGVPVILDHWLGEVDKVDQSPKALYGDQDVLHELVKDGMNALVHIHELPKQYNTLRIDLLDNTAPADIKMMHWTGAKGKDIIREMIND